MTAMDITIHASFLPHNDPDASLAFYRDTLGALGYHRRWPNPAPAVFGFHEVFHTFVCAAVACHYLAIAIFVL